MKRLFFIVLISFSFPSFSGGYPQLFFHYSWMFDGVCSTKENPVKKSWADEVREKIPEFKNQWEREAPFLFYHLFKKINGKSFKRKEYTVTLSACPNLVPFSQPIVINTTPYLEKPVADNKVVRRPKSVFTWIVFHELTHNWIEEHLDETVLIRKYKNESQAVLAHLHLLSVELYVFEKVGKKEILNWLEAFYLSPRRPEYGRAWEIVHKEGRDTFLNELN